MADGQIIVGTPLGAAVLAPREATGAPGAPLGAAVLAPREATGAPGAPLGAGTLTGHGGAGSVGVASAPGRVGSRNGMLISPAGGTVVSGATYVMRARRISTGVFVTWNHVGSPDATGALSPAPGDVTDIVVLDVVGG